MNAPGNLRIAQFSTHIGGGAAVAAGRLHGSLVAMGVDSRFHHYSGKSPDPTYRALGPVTGGGFAGNWTNDAFRRLDRWLARARLMGQPHWVEFFSFPHTLYRLRFGEMDFVPDVVHLHWIAGFFDLPTWFASVPPSVPIVWTLHDLNPVTGGCHYAGSCRGFEGTCGNCPQLGSPGAHDASFRNLQVKRKLLAGRNVHLVADSRWLESEARASSAFGDVRSVRTIHYGLDHQTFRPRDGTAIRGEFGIGDETFVIAFGAVSTETPRKGLHELLAALRLLDGRDVVLLAFGAGRLPDQAADLRVHHLGAIASERRLSELYSAADLFVIPSLQEAFGQTALEAMACGTPVVGFDVGGIPELVIPMKTGLLAEPGNVADLAARIASMESDREASRHMGAEARELVVGRFTLQHQARAYLELYSSLVDRHPPPRDPA